MLRAGYIKLVRFLPSRFFFFQQQTIQLNNKRFCTLHSSLFFCFLFKMRFTQIIAVAALAAPLALAAPAPTPTTPAIAELYSDLATNRRYAIALWQVKEKFSNLTEEDANTAARGYLEAIDVQSTGGASNNTALVCLTFFGTLKANALLMHKQAERDMKKSCCNNCDDCVSAVFTLGYCCISGSHKTRLGPIHALPPSTNFEVTA